MYNETRIKIGRVAITEDLLQSIFVRFFTSSSLTLMTGSSAAEKLNKKNVTLENINNFLLPKIRTRCYRILWSYKGSFREILRIYQIRKIFFSPRIAYIIIIII